MLVRIGAEMTLRSIVEQLVFFGSCTDMLRGYSRRAPRRDSHEGGRRRLGFESPVKVSPVSSVAGVGDWGPAGCWW